jgi:hypothetical protein
MALPLPVSLVEEVPEFEFRDGMFYVTCARSSIARAYRPSLFFATLAAMAQCARQYRVNGAEIIPMPPRAVHAASASGSPAK